MTARSAHPPAGGHTPGPWRWRGNTGEDYAALVSDVAGGPIIQTTHDVDPENPTAKLIASAPEQQAKIDALADALEALVRPQLVVFEAVGQPGSPMANAVAALRLAGRLP